MSLKQYNTNPTITKIKNLYEKSQSWNHDWPDDVLAPITPDLDLSKYPNYTTESKILVCKVEDVVYLLLQNHPRENIVYLADNDIRKNAVIQHYKVRAWYWNGYKKKKADRQAMLGFMKEHEDYFDIVCLRNRSSHKKDKKVGVRYKKLAEHVCKPQGYYSVGMVPMALANDIKKTDHEVFAFTFPRMESGHNAGSYVILTYQKEVPQNNFPTLNTPIDPANMLDYSILCKLLRPNSFDIYQQIASLTKLVSSGSVVVNQHGPDVVKLTGVPAQPFEFGRVSHKDLLPAGWKVLANKLISVNPAHSIATHKPAFPHICYAIRHHSWINYYQTNTMADFFRVNRTVTFIGKTLGLTRRQHYCFIKDFDVNEITKPTDYPRSYRLTEQEIQRLENDDKLKKL